MSKIRFRASLVLLAASIAALATVIYFNQTKLICFLEGNNDQASVCYVDAARVLELWDRLHGIHWAVRHGRVDRVRQLLDEEPELVDSRDFLLRTPLHLAIIENAPKTRDLLLERGARTDRYDLFLRTPLRLLKKRMPSTWYNNFVNGYNNDVGQEYAMLEGLARTDNLRLFRPRWKIFQRNKLPAARLDALNGGFLESAIKNDSIDVIEFLDANGLSFQRIGMRCAIQNGKNDLIKKLTAGKLDLSLFVSDDGSRLWDAVNLGNYDIINYFIGNGVNPNITTAYYEKPLLHYEIINNNFREVEFLLDHGADPNLVDKGKETPLDHAFKVENLKVVNSLVSHGAKDLNFPSALLRSAKDNRTDLLQVLLRLPGFSQNRAFAGMTPSSSGSTALHSAAGAWAIDALEFLLSQGADIDARDKDGKTPLVLATVAGNYRMVDYLILRGAYINSLDNRENGALSEASRLGFAPIVELLLERGARVDPGPQLVSPLHEAADQGRCEVIGQLYAAGSEALNAFLITEFHDPPNYPQPPISDRWRLTPLQLAARRKDYCSIKLLLDFGADVNSPTEAGNYWQRKISPETHLHTIISWSREEKLDLSLIDLLLINGADPNLTVKGQDSAITIAVWDQNLPLLKTLLAVGGKLPGKVNGRTLLHELADHRWDYDDRRVDPAMVDFLLSHGIKIDALDRNGWTAMGIAMRNNDTELIEILSARGANRKLAKKAVMSRGW